MSQDPDRDLPRDEHLRAALRHAPDADLAPPPDISAQILAAAHRAAAQRPAATQPRRRWWAWPDRPMRLGASGAFAVVVMAGVIGLVWRGETPGPATEGMVQAPTQAPTPAAAPAAAEPPRLADPASPPAPRPAPQRAPISAPMSAPVPNPTPAAQPAKEAGQTLEALHAARKVSAEADAAGRRRDAAESEARLRLATGSAPAVQPPPSPPAPAAAPAATPAATAAPSPATTTMADNAVRQERAAAPAPAPVLSGALGQAQALRRAPAAAEPAPAAGPNWREPQAAWSGEGASPAPSATWLDALAAQSQGRWRRAAAVPPARVLQVLRMDRPGLPSGRLWLAADRVVWCGGAEGEGCVEATLAPEAAAAFAAGLGKD